MKKLIGMRILKTALAVGMCVFISQLLKLEYPFYVAIAAIISMESSITSSYKAGRNRMAGTLVGAVVGLTFAAIQPNNALLCGLGTIVLIFVCEKFHWNNSISIAGIVFIAIMVNLNGHSPLLYGLNRILDTFIGISVALIINYLIFPPNVAAMVQEQFNGVITALQNASTQMSSDTPNSDLENIHGQIETLDKLIKAHGKDIQLFKRNTIDLAIIQKKLKICRNTLHHLAVLQDEELKALEPENNQQNPISQQDTGFGHEVNHSAIFTFHLQQIQQNLHSLQP